MTESTRRQIRGATLIWMLSVAASRAAGLIREMVIARYAGATGQTDVYFTAFTLPDFLNYLLAGGALSITFIPVFTALLVKGEEDDGWNVFSTAMTFLGAVLAALITVAWILAEPLCGFLASGFSAEQQVDLVRYTRILLPAQLFFFAGGLFGAVQMARGRHFIYAMSPLIYNAGLIAGGLLLGPRLGMEGFCWGALAGAALGHGVIQAVGASRAGMTFAPRLALGHPAFRQYLLLTLPFMIGQSILVADDWLIRYFGSHLTDASISWLNYAKRLALVIPAILGQASAVAAYPVLSRLAESGQIGEMKATLRTALARSLLLSAFGAVLLIVLNREATFLVFGGRQFSYEATLTTGRALAILAVGVPGWVAQAILARGFYALRDTWTPTLVGTAVAVAGIPFYGWCSRYAESLETGHGYLGLAAASAASITVYSLVLYLMSERKTRGSGAGPLLSVSFIVRSAVLIAATLVTAALVREGIGRLSPEPEFSSAVLRTAVTAAFSVGVFGGLGEWMGLGRETVLARMLRRRRR